VARFRVVLTDTVAADYDLEEQRFQQGGLDVERVYLRTHDAEEIVAQAATADALIISWVPITREVLRRLPRCLVIVRYGIGVDMIDLDAATEEGIVVCNTARYAIDEVSTHAITLLLTLNRGILADAERLRSGGWSGSGAVPPRRLSGQRLGLVGVGNIGRAVAGKAVGLGLQVMAFDPFIAVGTGELELVGLDELLRTSDFVSLHCPLNAATRHLIGTRELALMKPSAFLINTARGGIVDQAALTQAMADRRIAGAGLDVFEQEPLPANDVLRRLDNVVLTPHSAHWSVESAVECRLTAVEHVLTALRGGIPADVVNREVLSRANRRLRKVQAIRDRLAE